MTRRLLFPLLLLCILCAAGLGACAPSSSTTERVPRADAGYTHWLEQRSLFSAAERVLTGTPGWRAPANAVVNAQPPNTGLWLLIQPQNMIASPGHSVLGELSRPEARLLYGQLGLAGLHIDTLYGSGAAWQPHRSVMEADVDICTPAMTEALGTPREWRELTKTAQSMSMALGTGTLSPFTGSGPDFLLAVQNVRQWPHAFGLINIPRAQWTQLPALPPPADNAPPSLALLPEAQVTALQLAGLIPRENGTGTTPLHWAVTGEALGMDGVTRRWVYRALRTPWNPVLYWDDPAAAARRLLLGMAQITLQRPGLHVMGIGLQAAVTPHSADTAISESMSALLRDMSRTTHTRGVLLAQRDPLPLQSLRAQQEAGADMVFDSVTAPAVEYALLSGDAAPLRRALDEALTLGIDHSRLLRPLSMPHGANFTAANLDAAVLQPYLPGWSKNVAMRDGWVQCTLPGLAAMRVGLEPTPALMAAVGENRKKLQPLHELVLKFRGGLPGTLEITGQDLAGILYNPLELNDYPDLPGNVPLTLPAWGPGDRLPPSNAWGVPAGVSVYLPLNQQLADPQSFALSVARMAAVRKKIGVAHGTVTARPETRENGSAAVLTRLPDGNHLLVLANFADTAVTETLTLPPSAGYGKTDLWTNAAQNTSTFALKPFECRLLLLSRNAPAPSPTPTPAQETTLVPNPHAVPSPAQPAD